MVVIGWFRQVAGFVSFSMTVCVAFFSWPGLPSDLGIGFFLVIGVWQLGGDCLFVHRA